MIRIIGGEFRGHRIQTPSHMKTRPTQAKMREAWLNSIQSSIHEAKVLDLFAGSGALGFEALSRGAAQVVFVESSRSIAKLIHENIRSLEVMHRAKVLGVPVERAWKRLKKEVPFDLVFADPPYGVNWEKRLLEELPWEELLKEDGRFCIEWRWAKTVEKKPGANELPDKAGVLVKIREKNYGDSVLTTFVKKGS